MLTQLDTGLTAGSLADGGIGNDTYQILIQGSPNATLNFSNVTLTSIETLQFSTQFSAFSGNRTVQFTAQQFTEAGFNEIEAFRSMGDEFTVDIISETSEVATLDLSGLTFNSFDTAFGDAINITGGLSPIQSQAHLWMIRSTDLAAMTRSRAAKAMTRLTAGLETIRLSLSGQLRAIR